MLGEKGKKIVRFMEETRLGLTINQTALSFYPMKFGYDYARMKLRSMWDKGLIRRYTNDYSGELIYYLDKKPSYHNNAVLNVYANFLFSGYSIKEFKRELQLAGGKYRSDGFIIAENDKEIRIAFVEVDHSTPTNIKKYEEVYESQEFQIKYGEFPMVIILSDTARNFTSDNFTIANLNMQCTQFSKVLI